MAALTGLTVFLLELEEQSYFLDALTKIQLKFPQWFGEGKLLTFGVWAPGHYKEVFISVRVGDAYRLSSGNQIHGYRQLKIHPKAKP